MGPKQLENMEKTLMASSSEEEEESSSTEKESAGEESDEESAGEESGEESKESFKKPAIETSVVSLSGSKTTTKPIHVVRKRLLEKEEEGSKKKMKTSEEKPKQNMFVRIFTEEDEVVLLQGIIDFHATSGNPSEKMDAFYEFVKESISFDVTKDQLVTKTRNLKRKFDAKILKSLEKGITEEDQIVYSKSFDQRCYDLSRKIWGIDGVLPSKSSKMRLGGKVKDEEDEKPERSASLSSGQELYSFIKAENPTCLAFDEVAWIALWDRVKNGAKKQELEETLKRMKAMQAQLCMKRIGLLVDVAKEIFKEDTASSSEITAKQGIKKVVPTSQKTKSSI